MSFIAAMNCPEFVDPDVGVGVKGSDVYTETGVGDLRVTFYTQLNRGCARDVLVDHVRRFLQSDTATQTDFLTMLFQTRDIRGGKGEKDLFVTMMVEVMRLRPQWVPVLCKLIPEYGCWKDIWRITEGLLEFERTNKHSEKSVVPCIRAIDDCIRVQWEADVKAEHPSLLAKWLPREGSKFSTLAKHYADCLFPDVAEEDYARMRAYRKAVADVNRRIDTTEIKMCGGSWSTIEPRKVPGRLLKRCKQAFWNKKKNGEIRYPDREDRVTCTEHFSEFMTRVKSGEETIKGANVVYPHELVKEVAYGQQTNEELDVIQGQWDAIREETKKAGGLSSCVFMCDFSGSMDGVPKLVSLALGILGSELASEAFKDHILTFDVRPKWYSFKGITTLKQKVESMGNIGQGLNTNFQAACDLILKRLVKYKVPASEAPTDLIVLTDMGFDQASNDGATHNKKNGPWQTHFQMIRAAFEANGYTPPRIVCWNLRAEYTDYQARAHEMGVVQLSGWSPSAFKAISQNGVQVTTPYEGLRKVLDDPRYDRIREMCEELFGAEHT